MMKNFTIQVEVMQVMLYQLGCPMVVDQLRAGQTEVENFCGPLPQMVIHRP
jgi:hypothetical protein